MRKLYALMGRTAPLELILATMDIDQFDVKNCVLVCEARHDSCSEINNRLIRTQNCIGWNGTHSRSTIAKLWWNSQSALLTNAHIHKALLPASDDPASAYLKADWLSAVGGVENSAIFQGSLVVYLNMVTHNGLARAIRRDMSHVCG